MFNNDRLKFLGARSARCIKPPTETLSRSNCALDLDLTDEKPLVHIESPDIGVRMRLLWDASKPDVIVDTADVGV